MICLSTPNSFKDWVEERLRFFELDLQPERAHKGALGFINIRSSIFKAKVANITGICPKKVKIKGFEIFRLSLFLTNSRVVTLNNILKLQPIPQFSSIQIFRFRPN